jgi:hypothetical protein
MLGTSGKKIIIGSMIRTDQQLKHQKGHNKITRLAFNLWIITIGGNRNHQYSTISSNPLIFAFPMAASTALTRALQVLTQPL